MWIQLLMNIIVIVQIVIFINKQKLYLLMLESRHKGSNTASVRSLIVDDMRPGRWLELVLSAPSYAMTLMVGYRRYCQSMKTSCSTNPQTFFSREG